MDSRFIVHHRNIDRDFIHPKTSLLFLRYSTSSKNYAQLLFL